MISKLLKKYPIIREMFLYGLIGGSTALVDTLVYTVLTHLCHMNELIANFIGVNIGIALSFVFNTFFNFKKTDRIQKRAVSFFIVGYLGLGLSMLILYLGVDVLQLFDIYVKLASVVIVAIFQFVLNKLVTYGKVGEQAPYKKQMHL